MKSGDNNRVAFGMGWGSDQDGMRKGTLSVQFRQGEKRRKKIRRILHGSHRTSSILTHTDIIELAMDNVSVALSEKKGRRRGANGLTGENDFPLLDRGGLGE